MKHLIVNEQLVCTVEDLRACFNQNAATRPGSSLFNNLIDKFIDGDIESFLYDNNEDELAQKIGMINKDNPDSELMRELVSAITEEHVVIKMDPLSYLEVVEASVTNNRAIFRLRVIKHSNERIQLGIKVVRESAKQPHSSIYGISKKIYEYVKQQYYLDEPNNNLRKSKTLNNWLGLSSREPLADPEKKKELPTDPAEKKETPVDIKNKTIELRECRIGEIIVFERDVPPDCDVLFFIGNIVVKSINAEDISYEFFCANHGDSTQYDSSEISTLHDNALKGWKQFQLLLGDAYRFGNGVNQSYSSALSWYSKSAQKGCAAAQCKLGEMYLYGKGTDINYSEALNWFQKSSNQGDAMGLFRLGSMYLKGKGVTTDYSKAFDFISKSAMKNNPMGQCILGKMFEDGDGVCKDEDKAFDLYLKSAMQNDALGLIYLGIFIESRLGWDINEQEITTPPEIRSKYDVLFSLFKKVIINNDSIHFEINEHRWSNLLEGIYIHAGENEDAWELYNWNKKKKMNEYGKVGPYIPAAIAGSALCLIAVGKSVNSDSEKSKYFERASLKKGVFAGYASIIMGYRYENGHGVYKSQSMADSFYYRAKRYFGSTMVDGYLNDIKRSIKEYNDFWNSLR